MKKISGVIVVGFLCLSMFWMVSANLRPQSAKGGLTTGTSIGPQFISAHEFSDPFSSYSAHSLESSQGQGSCDTGLEDLSAADYTPANYPQSISYQDYTSIGASTQFSVSAPAGLAAISLGVMNGSAAVQVSQGGQVLLSKSVAGGSFDYVALTAANSYCYVNFDSSGQPLNVTASTISSEPIVAYNVYDNYISDYTASLITYPPQFALNLGPPSTPENTGLSFLLVAPNYTQPTPLSIWVGEGFSDPTTGKSWYAQVGSLSPAWVGSDSINVSYPFWEAFSNIFGSTPPYVDLNYPLTPGDTYNFTMMLVSDTTWEFAVNGTQIQEDGVTGFLNTTSSVSNGGADLGLETLTAWGGNVGITNLISVPTVMTFLVNGEWSEPGSFAFGTVGENWWNGNATSSPGIDLWGIAGHLEDSSVPVGSLLFNDSLPMSLDIPGTESEPIYGDYSYPQTSSGGGLVAVEVTSSTSLQVSPVSTPSFVSVVTYESGDYYMTSLTDAMVTAPAQFTVPEGTDVAVVYAANSSFNQTSSSVVNIVPLYHDVSIEGVIASKSVVGSGYSMSINVAAADLGSYTETVNVTAYANATIIGSENVTLSSGNSMTVTFTWNTAGFDYGNYALSAYALLVPGETNMGNNNMTGGTVYVGIPGDVDGIGRVNMNDVVSILKAFGSTVGEPNYNPNCDIDGKGRVDMSDVVIALSNFGQHYP